MNHNIKRGLVLVGAMVAGVAQAEVPAAATTAITTAGTDAATVGTAVFVVLVGIKAFKWLRRAL